MSIERKIPTQAEIEKARIVPDIEGKDIIKSMAANSAGKISLKDQMYAADKLDPMADDLPYFA